MSSSRVQQFGAAVFSVLMVTSMFVGVVALGAGTASALEGGAITVDDVTATPDTTNDVSDYTINITVDTGTAGSPASDLVIQDDTGGNYDLSTVDNVTILDNSGSNVSDGIASQSNNRLEVDLSGGSFSASAGDEINITLAGVTNGNTPGEFAVEAEFTDTPGTDDSGATGTANVAIDPSLVVSGLSAPRVAANNSVVTVEATVENQGASAVDTTPELRDSATDFAGTPAGGSGTTVASASTVTLNAGESTTVTINANTSSDYNQGSGGDFFHGIVAPDDTTGVDESAVTAQFFIGAANQSGAVTAEVLNTDGFPVTGADVRLYKDSVDPSNLVAQGVANGGPEGNRIRFEDLAIGANTSASVEYIVEANTSGFQADTRSAELDTNNVEQTVFPELQRIVNADRISATDDTALADDVDVATSTVLVETQDNQNNNFVPLDNTTVEVIDIRSVSGSISPSDLNNVALDDPANETDSNGEIVFEATSDVPGTVEVEFEATDSGNDFTPVTTNATLTFIPEGGEVTISGDVLDADSQDNEIYGIEDASVYAVRTSTFLTNERFYNYTTPTGDDVVNDTAYFRVINADTGEVVSNQDYTVFENGIEGEAAQSDDNLLNLDKQTEVGDIQQLNTTDAGVGSGFFAREVNEGTYTDTDRVEFSVVPHLPGNYTVQVSDEAPNASRQDTAPSADESFGNITDDNGNEVIQVSTELTASATADRFSSSPAQPVDDTNEDGNYVLSNLALGDEITVGTETTTERSQFFTSQPVLDAGYFVIADDVEYKRSVQLVTFEQQDDDPIIRNGQRFLLEQVPVRPNQVNITQVGTHPNQAYDPAVVDEFGDQSDATFQRVPRDGTIDVINVTAAAEAPDGSQQAVNTSVTVTLNESFDGQFLDTVVGGDLISNDENTTTITFATGQDGEARLLLETEENSTSLDARKVATLDENTAVTDSSNVTFVGIQTLREASISGIVTDTNDDPLPGSAVWAQRFDVQTGVLFPDRIVINPDTTASPGTAAYAEAVDDDSDTFNVELRAYNVSAGAYETVRSTTLTASQLQAYDFSDFPSLSQAATADDFKLYQRASPGDATYTLDPVPAVNSTQETDYRIRAVKTDTPFIGAQSNDALPSVLPQTTDDANVVIPVDVETANLQVSNLNAPLTAEQGEDIQVSATVTNEGGDQGNEQTVEFRVDTTGDGTFDATLASDTVQVQSNTSATVTLNATIPSNLAPDDYEHGIFTGDDSATDTINVTAGSGDGGLEGEFDGIGPNDGVVDSQEVLAVIEAFNDDTDDRVTEANTVLDVIGVFNSDDPSWDNVGS